MKLRRTCALILPWLFGFIASRGFGQSSEAPPLKKENLEAAYRPQRLALVVGINEFRDPNWRSLQYAIKDAQDMAKNLRDPALAGFDQVLELDHPWDTGKAGLLEALRQLSNLNMSPDDVVLIYISTHGTLAHDPESRQLQQYLVCYDTQYDQAAQTALNMSQLLDLFSRLASRKKVLILATCHSGLGKSELPPDIQNELSHLKAGFFVKPLEFMSQAAVIIGASAWGETALEDPKLQNDIYTHFFLEGMSKGDRNQDGAVSLSEAHDYAQRQTYYYTQGRQRPFARSDILGADPIILTGKISRDGKPVLFSYGEKLEGSTLWLNGQEKGALPDGFSTDKGWNKVQLQGDSSRRLLSRSYLYLRNGERVDVERWYENRNEPRLGVMSVYRMIASGASDEVLPDLPLYGLAYQWRSFPFTPTDLLLLAAFGQTQWQTEADQLPVQVTANVVETSLAWLYSYPTQRTRLFLGPLVGVLALQKDLRFPEKNRSRDSATVFPGIMAGVNFRLSRQVRLELADRLSYDVFQVNQTLKPTLANEVSATCYFQTPAWGRKK